MLKQLLGNPLVQFLIGRTMGLYMLFVGVTTRWEKVNRQAIEPFFRGDKPMIGCIWHGRFALVHKMWAFGPGIPRAKMLISQSREGGIVAHVSRAVGAEVIRGSAPKGQKRKGGVEAMRAMARHIEGGGVICMTPDGPRGPRMRAKLAPVQLAKLAGADLVGVAWSTKNRKVFSSWDRFILPLPFGRGALVWSDPIPAPAPDADSAELEAIRAKLEAEMIRIAAEADRIAGADVIDPEPAPRLEPAPAAT
ncbi:MAG: lysophospholipid acyltransferase family protein [Hyphomonadaceae bacterium]|nr:lysophospholipid acyltransferase family protein [Hyphomonadaceae bacterium]